MRGERGEEREREEREREHLCSSLQVQANLSHYNLDLNLTVCRAQRKYCQWVGVRPTANLRKMCVHVSVYVCVLFKMYFLTPNTELALLDNTTISHKPQRNLRGMEKDEKKAEAGANERETRQSATHTHTHTHTYTHRVLVHVLAVFQVPKAPRVPRVCVFWLGTILRFHPWTFWSQCSGPGLPTPHRCCFN